MGSSFVTITPPLTGRFVATTTTVVATGRTITTVEQTESGLLRPAGAITMVTESTVGASTATRTILALPTRLAVSLKKALSALTLSPAAEAAAPLL